MKAAVAGTAHLPFRVSSVELVVLHGLKEGRPFGDGEGEVSSGALRVTYGHAMAELRDLDAV
ncbi:hypothetical protein NOGI109294_11115 [Nocardiopsis gilva]